MTTWTELRELAVAGALVAWGAALAALVKS